ncbi:MULTISPECIES: hypothetical protein [Staphylococcus]|uniref:Uncharacterized protein n=5 Tax=root TaxID=1 RepID=A0A509LVG7_STAEP|nr:MULTISPECIES: hypothetical protein [Staphylococcus]EON83189.1 hypothetical protein H700_02182 [Staphylococcus epidermidis 41tr]EON84121.1 hypothetical protein H701_01977 [Staphylococcus epidermidis 528m]EON84818.1 hypothetical protein D592_14294 [Staphylococcus epidermidis 36-1]MDU7271526.1 hypothetical protein [Staphylococcus lugdunensis]QPB07586.1 hypothetical protein PLKLOBMN_00015 [Staphylococcus phage PhiSepi-HH1]DAJ17245.1 MAG TPA: hypothetical protein [Siphoviridae sp. ctza41]
MNNLLIPILFIVMCITYYLVPFILNKLIRIMLGLVMCISLSASVTLAFIYSYEEYIIPMIIGIILIEIIDIKTDKYDINRKIKKIFKQQNKELRDRDIN